MQKILFLTTNNLTTNPRLLKEVNLAKDNGIAPTVICFDFDNWTREIEGKNRSTLSGVELIIIPASRKIFKSWFFSSAINFFCRKLSTIIETSVQINAFASEKRSFSLCRKLDALRSNYSIVISHTLGALYPAATFAKKNKIPFAFDIEDYHPGEKVYYDENWEVKRRECLMKRLLPQAHYVSYASPLIGKATLDLVPELKTTRHFLVNNSFLEEEFVTPNQQDGKKLRFVWFSQNIAEQRGLEMVVPILYKYRDSIHLTLIGNLVPSFYSNFLSQFDELIFHKTPLTQEALHHELANHDIGLAIEISKTDFNRDISLSNKIFAYAQAGLYIMATDTKAQTLFMAPNPSGGKVFMQSESGFEVALKEVLFQKEKILALKQERFEIGKNLAWEKEAVKLLDTWKSLTRQFS